MRDDGNDAGISYCAQSMSNHQNSATCKAVEYCALIPLKKKATKCPNKITHPGVLFLICLHLLNISEESLRADQSHVVHSRGENVHFVVLFILKKNKLFGYN